MSVTARPMPRPAAGARPGAPARRPVRPLPAHRPEPHKQGTDTSRLILIGGVLAVAAVIGVAVIWEFGAARNLAVPDVAVGSGADSGAAATGGRSTMLYRDMRDGRIMVMEVGPGGTRLKGTVSKNDLPIAADADRPGGSTRSGGVDPSAADRVNALGSAFR